MNPRKSYQSSQAVNWSRIEMLIALYREAEMSIRQGLNALHENDDDKFVISQLRSLKLLLAIIDGIKNKQDELTGNIYQLCLFVFDQVSKETEEGLQNGLRVLVTLKESFEAVEEEAKALECNGEIPPLDYDLDGTLAVG